jgi:phospholipase C
VEDIYNAKFKAEPNGFKKLTEADVAGFIQDPINQHVMSQQEKGIRPSCALPYELHVNGKLSADQQSFEIRFGAGNMVFGGKSAGAPFTVVAPGKFQDALSKAGAEVYRNWSFGVVAGDELTYKWPVGAFEGSQYQLLVNGPNGFFRSFKGFANEASINIHAEYEKVGLKLTGNVLLKITNQNRSKTYAVMVEDNGYGNRAVKNSIKPGQRLSVVIAAAKSHGWYDTSVRIEGSRDFEQRFAGRVETGTESFSDPVMGRSPK